jgi:hypothetical protein
MWLYRQPTVCRCRVLMESETQDSGTQAVAAVMAAARLTEIGAQTAHVPAPRKQKLKQHARLAVLLSESVSGVT